MIGCRCSHRFEIRAPLLQDLNQSPDAGYLEATQLREAVDLLSPVRSVDVDDAVRAKRRHHAPFPAGLANRTVMVESIGGAIGCRQHLDVEALEQTAGPKFGFRELRVDVVINRTGRLAGELLFHTEYMMKLLGEPHARR